MSLFPSSRNRRVNLQDVLDRVKREEAATKLSLGEATALVASRTMDDHDTRRTAENRVRTQICRALTVGISHPKPPEDGTCLVAGADNRIPVGELIRWATEKYGKRFDGLPKKSRILDLQLDDGLVLASQVDSVMLPGLPERKDEEILRQHAEIRRLESEATLAKDRRKQELVARFKSK